MTAQASDVIAVLTGGSLNTNPNQSLGGAPSNHPITSGVLDNLFSDVTEAQATAGKVDYRCMYIFNNNSTDSLYNFKVYVNTQVNQASTVLLGMTKQQEVQMLTLSNGPVTGGYINFSYQGVGPFSANWDASYSTFATNIQTALNNLFQSTSVTVGSTGATSTFNVLFNGSNDYRYHDLITVDTTHLSPSISATMSRVIPGAPINYIHDMLDSELTLPSNVNFVSTSLNSPILIGTLKGTEGFALWVQRTTPANTVAVADDNFTLKILSNPISV